MAIVIGIALLVGFSGYFNGVTWASLTDAVLRTTYRLVLAYGIALVIGVSIALIVGWSPFIDFFFPFFDILQNLPSFALFPFLIYFLGFTDVMIILFAVSSIVWPILFAILTAIKNAHNDLNDAATIFGARGFHRPAYMGAGKTPFRVVKKLERFSCNTSNTNLIIVARSRSSNMSCPERLATFAQTPPWRLVWTTPRQVART